MDNQPKWPGLLDDPNVRRWHDNLANASTSTARGYLKSLGRLLHGLNQTPQGFLDLPAAERDDLVFDFIMAGAKRKVDGETLKKYRSAAQSWLLWRHAGKLRPMKIPGLGLHPTLEDAKLPLQEQLRLTLDAAGPGNRVALAMICFTGVRPGVLGRDDGTDGLRLEHFVEAHLDGGTLVFDHVPTMIHVPAELSKTRQPYVTFLGPEGCGYVQAYLKARSAAGEVLTGKSPLIRPRNREGPYMRSQSISQKIRIPMRRVGLKEPPYIWRSYFSNACLIAHRDGLSQDCREFMMGHSGGIALRYGLRKGAIGRKLQLTPRTVEELRAGYQAALKHLETTMPLQTEDPMLGMVALLLKAGGLSEEDVQAQDLSRRSREEVVDLLKATFQSQAKGKGPKQRVVPLADVPKLTAEGWLWRGNLGDGQAVIEQPA